MIPLRALFLTIIIIIEKNTLRSATSQSVVHCVEPVFAYLLEREEYRDSEHFCNPPDSHCDFQTNICVGSEKRTLRSKTSPSLVHCVDPESAYILKRKENRDSELFCNPPFTSCDFETNICVEEPEEERYRAPNQCYEQSLAFLLKTGMRDVLPLECKPPLPVCDFKKNQCVPDERIIRDDVEDGDYY